MEDESACNRSRVGTQGRIDDERWRTTAMALRWPPSVFGVLASIDNHIGSGCNPARLCSLLPPVCFIPRSSDGQYHSNSALAWCPISWPR